MTSPTSERLSPADEPLLPRIAAGDRLAVNACIRRYGPLVWSMARRFSATTTDAEDAVQEIFMDLWASAARFDANRGPERVFVTLLARRRLIDRRRSSHRHESRVVPLDDVPEAESSPGTHAERDAEIELARSVLAQLPAVQQRVITLALAHGYSHAEVAERTGLPLGTVKTLVRRGILKVRAMLLPAAPAAAVSEERP